MEKSKCKRRRYTILNLIRSSDAIHFIKHGGNIIRLVVVAAPLGNTDAMKSQRSAIFKLYFALYMVDK